ncbi:MAG: serine/threonine-protein kinase [Acidobacteriota bacterium]
MNAKRWQAIKDILDVALDLPVTKRRGFIAEACAEDAELLNEVTSLLDLETEISSTFIDQPVFSLRSPEASGARVGEIIGPFTLVEEIGRGGMGVVYGARRHDSEFEQHVAVKILKRGMDTEAVVQRFRYERQILANLRHPYISRLFDGGTTEDNLPFLVMERVDGDPLTRWCDHRHLNLRERIELFLEVCEAVSFAHRNLVIHRDLKPANVLVDEDGRPRLLDFGIAKIIADEPALTAPETAYGLHLLTPEYASPEQLLGEPITTSADLYCLGVILYELLTGRRPFDRGNDTSSRPNRLEMARRVETETLLQPSAAVRRRLLVQGERGQQELTPERVSQDRSESPSRLRRELRGDLDAIVLKTLRRNPEERYPSVDALATDLRQYLRGLPVEARRGSTLYRIKKFAQRNVAVLTVIATLLLTLVASIAFVQQQQETERQRQQAQLESQRRNAVRGFVVEAFRTLDPGNTGGQLTPEEQLQRVTNEIISDENLDQNPLAKAEVLALAAEIHQDRSLLPRALELYTEAYEIYRRELGEASLEAAETGVNRATVLGNLKQITEAEHELRHNIAILRILRQQQIGSESLSGALVNLGSLLRRNGQLREAKEKLVEGLEIKRELFSPGDPTFIEALNNLATLERNRGAYDLARSYVEESLSIRRQQAEGKATAELYRGLNSLGLIELYAGLPERAIEPLEESLRMRQTIEGRQGQAVVTGLISLSRAYSALDRWEYAEALLAEAETLCQARTADGEDICKATHVGAIARNRAEIEERRGRGPECLAQADLALEAYAGSSNLLRAEALRIRASCLVLVGDLIAARRELSVALGMLRDIQEPEAFQRRRAERLLVRLDEGQPPASGEPPQTRSPATSEATPADDAVSES